MEPGPDFLPRCPRTRDELAALINDRPRGWEYLLYGGGLYLGRKALETKYHDHLFAYAELDGPPLDADRAIREVDAAVDDARAMVGRLMHMFDPVRLEWAFGEPGKPGDPALIQHVADRTMKGYEHFMDWARRLRSMRVPAEFRKAFDLAADLMSNPVEECREYVDQVVTELDQVPNLIETSAGEGEEPVQITLQLTLTVDEDARRAFTDEIERLQQEGFG